MTAGHVKFAFKHTHIWVTCTSSKTAWACWQGKWASKKASSLSPCPARLLHFLPPATSTAPCRLTLLTNLFKRPCHLCMTERCESYLEFYNVHFFWRTETGAQFISQMIEYGVNFINENAKFLTWRHIFRGSLDKSVGEGRLGPFEKSWIDCSFNWNTLKNCELQYHNSYLLSLDCLLKWIINGLFICFCFYYNPNICYPSYKQLEQFAQLGESWELIKNRCD